MTIEVSRLAEEVKAAQVVIGDETVNYGRNHERTIAARIAFHMTVDRLAAAASAPVTAGMCLQTLCTADATRLLAESQAHNAKLEAQVERLRDVATGKIKHVFNGLCPDEIEGPDVRDPDCVACQILDAALKP